MSNLSLTSKERTELLNSVTTSLESYYENTKNETVVTDYNIEEIRAFASQFDFDQLNDSKNVLSNVIEGLKKYSIHAAHPGYLGLFNPRPNYVSILAEYIMSVINPNLAAWSHSAYATEVEQFVIHEFGKRFGYAENSIDGTFCTGGAESNLTALLTAINHHFPDFGETGWIGTAKKPIIYCSSESHHSVNKAAKSVGLGNQSIVHIPVGKDLTINTQILEKRIKEDIADGFHPFMIVATAGTTGSGAIDNLEEISRISKANNLWFHVDAAYGGAMVVHSDFSKWMKGIAQSDSTTIDLHKWFSVSMGASLFLTSHKTILHKTFQISTNYMPKDGDPNQVIDQYIHSIQWSRRFIGLKIYLPLAIHGWQGFEETIRLQLKRGNQLRQLLIENGWQIKNDTNLPVVCFSHPDLEGKNDLVEKINTRILQSEKVWISVYPIHGEDTFRACITNYQTTLDDLKTYIEIFNRSKNEVLAESECVLMD